ncbi:MAG: hypothetical protein ABIE14_00845 [Patescibacteria group bacterium]
MDKLSDNKIAEAAKTEVPETKPGIIAMIREQAAKLLPSLSGKPETLRVETVKFLGRNLELIPEHAKILRVIRNTLAYYSIDDAAIQYLKTENHKIVAITSGWGGWSAEIGKQLQKLLTDEGEKKMLEDKNIQNITIEERELTDMRCTSDEFPKEFTGENLWSLLVYSEKLTKLPPHLNLKNLIYLEAPFLTEWSESVKKNAINAIGFGGDLNLDKFTAPFLRVIEITKEVHLVNDKNGKKLPREKDGKIATRLEGGRIIWENPEESEV